MAKIPRYRLRDSDRSGFQYREITLVKDEGVLVGADEFDTPPPSDVSLGGEGDISSGDVNPNFANYDTPSGYYKTTQYVTAAGGISAQRPNADIEQAPQQNWIYVVGSNQAVTVTANPQVSAGQQNDWLIVECVGSSITLIDGSGLSLYSSRVTLNSGSILNLFYSQSDSLWHETSRSSQTTNLGVF